MTKTNTPDRIWVTASMASQITSPYENIVGEVAAFYLLSTPARAQADALLTTLAKVRDACLVDDPHGLTVETEVAISYELFAEMQDAIDKAKGTDNDRF